MMRGLGLRRQGSWVINIDHVSADRPPSSRPSPAAAPLRFPPCSHTLPLVLQAPSSADVSDELITEAVFSTDTDGDGLPHQLFNAAVHGNHPLLVALLDRKVDPNVYRSDHGTTALIAAAGAGHAQCVETLLECGANPSAKNSFGETAESVAKTNGHAGVLKKLPGGSHNFDCLNSEGIACRSCGRPAGKGRKGVWCAACHVCKKCGETLVCTAEAKKVEADAGGSFFAWRRSGASSAGLFG